MEAAAGASMPTPPPPQRLDDHALRFWESTVNSKRRSAWTDSDLLSACQLCRDLAAVEILSADIEQEGYTLIDGKGKKYPNPAARLLDAATRRVLATQKHLQIHSLATNGKTEAQPNKNEAARAIKANVSTMNSLIPQPQQMN